MSEVHTLIELTGHIVDSLTMAKVFDKIDALQCRHQLREFQIGQNKHDVSVARIDVWAQNDELLANLLNELKPYGIQAISEPH